MASFVEKPGAACTRFANGTVKEMISYIHT